MSSVAHNSGSHGTGCGFLASSPLGTLWVIVASGSSLLPLLHRLPAAARDPGVQQPIDWSSSFCFFSSFDGVHIQVGAADEPKSAGKIILLLWTDTHTHIHTHTQRESERERLQPGG